MIELYPHQNKQINQTRAALRQHRRVLLQASTGAGKTVMATSMIHSASNKNNVPFFICHRRELVDQTASTFDNFDLDFGIIAAGHKEDYSKGIYIASIDTLKNRVDRLPVTPRVVFWDEAHHLAASGWSGVQDHYSNAYHIGLSATPERADGKGLCDRFDALIPGQQTGWLIDNGFLAQYDLYSVPGFQRENLHQRMGKYIVGEVEYEINKPSITGNIIAHWKKLASDKITIGFAASVMMSKRYVEEFNAAGIPSAHLDAKTHKDDRKRILREFAMGRIRVLWNVSLFGEGFDVAANSGMDVTVGCVIDASPTKSLAMWLQRCGRALRKQADRAIILDHCGNIDHGLPCQDRVWTLDGRDANKRANANEEYEPTKQCPECFMVHKPAPQCPACNHVYETKARIIDEVDGELEKIDKERQRQGQAQTADELDAYRKQKGYKKGFEQHVMRARQEKDQLRKQVYNLAVATGQKMPKSKIWAMKPKQLKETIQMLEEMLDERSQA